MSVRLSKGYDICHIQVVFSRPAMTLEFQDLRSVAAEFAAAAGDFGTTVTIDDDLSADLRPLPCRQLWT